MKILSCVSPQFDSHLVSSDVLTLLYKAFHLRLMLWTCPAECDYTCQHVITDARLNREFPMLQPIVQFHGKWPFYRVLGMQEIFSVFFSFLNFFAHYYGSKKMVERIPASYPLRKYYVTFGYFGMASWIFSMIFHARDFPITEKLDYWAAGASILYGLYLAVIRVFRLDDRRDRSKSAVRRLWTTTCIVLYIAHVSYLGFWSWDYTYNMIANVVVGTIQNLMWIVFSIHRFRKDPKKPWTLWPALIVTWIMAAMSLELFDFPPWWGLVDAHSLWHLGTVVPAAWWYAYVFFLIRPNWQMGLLRMTFRYLINDAQDDMNLQRLKA